MSKWSSVWVSNQLQVRNFIGCRHKANHRIMFSKLASHLNDYSKEKIFILWTVIAIRGTGEKK